ncbi:uncharacterized protein LOC130115290 [Lampris incognitus]|uniref:uncharacterized protein LOC130115290 n=1 Tax=Lampris incognitus TaxID=2546036 RepID=UPI0024B52C20|nr:uncharacterized protein LOC130115290 [Lampris incognitus]
MEPPEELECSSEVAPVRLSENLEVEQKPAVEPRGPERVIPERVVLPVAPPPQEKDGGEPLVFLEVLNQEMKSESFPHNFTVCFSTMFDFTNTLQLVQSIEMLRLLGVTRVVVYKTNCSSKTQVLLDYYQNTGLVEVIPWHLSSLMNVSRGWQPQYSPGQMHYYGQIPALTDCVYRYMYRSKYLALHDMDELILPQTVDSWGELLPLLEQQLGSDFGYLFENSVFPVTASLPPPPSSLSPNLPHGCCPAWKDVPGVNILAHLYHEPVNQWTHSNFKMIINPRAVFRPTVHGLLSSQKGHVWVSGDIARMYHTRAPMETKLTPDQLIYDSRLLGYSDRLILAVNTVLEETGLVQEEDTQQLEGDCT